MKPAFRLILIVMMLVVLAAGSYTGATGLIEAMMQYQSPLANNPPAPAAPLGEPGTRQLVIILADALRLDTAFDNRMMPTLNGLMQAGASAPMQSRPPSYSAPGYSTLFTGAWPEINSGPAFNTEYDLIEHPWSQDNLFSAAHRAGLKVGVSGFNWFEKLIPAESVDLKYYTPYEDDLADTGVLLAALHWLENPTSQVILIHLDQLDYAGHHQGGPQGDGWQQAAIRVDRMISKVVSAVDLDQDTVVIFGDHGQIDTGGHGGTEEVVLREPFIMVGKGVKPGEYPQVMMVDVAPTLAALLGTNIPASSQGSAQLEMLNLPPVVESAVEKQQSAVHTELAKAYQTVIGYHGPIENIDDSREALLNVQRGWRLPVALLLAIGLPLVFLWKKVRARIPVLAGGLIAFLLFQLRYAVLDGKGYSFSEISSPTELVTYSAITILTAMLLGFIFAVVTHHQKFTHRSEAAFFTASYIFASIYFWLIPLLINFWWNGFLPGWTLPQLDVYFWALLGYIGILFSAAGGLLLLAIVPIFTKINQNKISNHSGT